MSTDWMERYKHAPVQERLRTLALLGSGRVDDITLNEAADRIERLAHVVGLANALVEQERATGNAFYEKSGSNYANWHALEQALKTVNK